MTDLMAGHGPAPDFGPYVPDYVIVQSGDDRRRVVSRDGHVDVPEENLKVTPCTPEPMRPGSWPLVSRDGDIGLPSRTEWFPLADEKRWRPVRAQALLASAQSLVGHPELAIRTIRAASALVSFDIEKAARDLAAVAVSGETLDQTYERRGR